MEEGGDGRLAGQTERFRETSRVISGHSLWESDRQLGGKKASEAVEANRGEADQRSEDGDGGSGERRGNLTAGRTLEGGCLERAILDTQSSGVCESSTDPAASFQVAEPRLFHLCRRMKIGG